MSKHRRSTRHRKIATAVLAAVVVGTPSVALASDNWGWHDAGDRQDRQRHESSHRYGDGDRQDRDHDGSHSHWRDKHWQDGETPTAGTGKPRPSTSPDAGSSKPTSEPASKPTSKPAPPAGGASTGKPSPTASANPGAAQSPAPVTSSPTPGTPQATPSATPSATGAPAASDAVNRVLQLVNTERGKVGCAPLTLDAKLAKAAQAHSEDMARNHNMSHTGSDGSSSSERIKRAGYSASSTGENVAYGYSTPEKVMQGWMSSSGHKRNILDCDYRHIGIGLAEPGHYWTQDFASPR